MATFTSTASTPSEDAIRGMAGVMMVASRISMKNAPATSSAIPRGNRAGFSGLDTEGNLVQPVVAQRHRRLGSAAQNELDPSRADVGEVDAGDREHAVEPDQRDRK